MLQFRDLHESAVQIVMGIDDRSLTLVGQAQFEEDTAEGPLLRICICESTGDFEFIISEREWNGTIERASQEVPYCIRLGAGNFAET